MTTPAANFATISSCVVDTGGNFANGVNDTGGKFDTGGKLPPVSTSPAANLPLVSLTPVEDFFHLPPVSTTPVANLELLIPLRIFEKIQNSLNRIRWGWGETDSDS
jgi:hypothetical protein